MAGAAPFDRSILTEVGAQLERYLDAPAENAAALEMARSSLHRLRDSLESGRFEGAAAFCAELETVLDELSADPDIVSALHREVLRQVLLGLARHLDALAEGADDAALRLFQEYQALQQLRGMEMSFELDLFHPDLDVPLPQQVLAAPVEDDAPHRLRTLRGHYQQGLLHWLRQDDASAALLEMREALDGALRCVPQDGNRAFWWIACGLLDCLRQSGTPTELSVNRLLARIDQQLRATAEGHVGDVRPVIKEMLYLIGSSSATRDLLEEIRLCYALEFHLPGTAGLSPDDAAPILDAMRDHLKGAEESWEECVQGRPAAYESFSAYAGQLAVQGSRLGSNAMRFLSGRIYALSQSGSGPEYAQRISLEMAMALLLLGSGTRHYGNLDSRFLKAARILVGRIEAAARREPEDAQQLAELVRLHCRLQQDDVSDHLFNEMLVNLQYVEQGLNAFFGDPAKRNELNELLRLSGQILGGLHVAALEVAAQLLASIFNCIRRFAQGDDMPEQTESLALNDAVKALEKYLRHLAQRQAADVAPLQAALEAMPEMREAPSPAVAEHPAAPAGITHPAGEDEELLEVFLEEAQEVLHVMRNDLEACRLRPNRETLVNIRRGFHTLKGSGRMVGLSELGEVAWNVERALNKCLQDNRPVTPGLLHFIADAEQRFSGWVNALNSQGGVSIEADDLAAAAQQVESGIKPGQPEEDVVTATLPEKEAVTAHETREAPPPTTALPEQAIVEKAAPAVAVEKPPTRDEIDVQLLPVFLEEADETFPQIDAGLRAWRAQPDDEHRLQLLKRLLHTFKGSARMAGAMRIGSIAHEMEARIISGAEAVPQAGLWDVLEGELDRIAGLLEKLRAAPSAATEAAAVRRAPEYTGVERRSELRETEGGAEHAMLRVRADAVDRLVNEAGEISMARARIETEMRAFKEGLQELTGSVTRLRRQLREVDMQAESRIQAHASLSMDSAEQFDPLEFDRFTRLQELMRFMNESVHDVLTVQRTLQKNFDGAATALASQARLNRELQQNLMNVRMVPFASIGERLYRIVRQTAKELGKRANLELLGTELELDRGVLEKMTAPFEHLLRNALVHGIESGQVREQGGKSPIGEIRLGLRHEGNEVVFEFGDDGAGLDLDALRDRAIAKEMLEPEATVSDERLAQLVFESGISTAAEVTEVAGRGIGMDVVCSEIAALGGRIAVKSQKGRGAWFTIHLPLTLAVTHVLMLRSGKETCAIPSTAVEQVRQAKPEELAQFYRDRQIEWQGNNYPFAYLPHLLGDSARVPESHRHNPVVLLRSGEQRIALHVDGLLGNQEAMVKNTGPQLAQLPVVAGATVQGNGEVALILNPAQLALHAAAGVAAPAAGAAPEVPCTQPLVMVVDDSLTVRKVTTRLLTRAGYQTITARDGVEALELLGESLPDVMLLDIEMPRMDGFELARHLRRDERTRHLPIIMITSRAADKHRDHALQLGVNAYLGKPYQEDVLLREIAGFAPVAQPVSG